MSRQSSLNTYDRGDIISSWLIKVTLGLAIAGVLLFDVISITSTRLSVHDTARGAARDAADASGKTRDPATAYTAAQTFATELNALNQVDPATFALAEDGSVRLSLERTAPTLVVERIGWIRHWAEVRDSGTAAPLR